MKVELTEEQHIQIMVAITKRIKALQDNMELYPDEPYWYETLKVAISAKHQLIEGFTHG